MRIVKTFSEFVGESSGDYFHGNSKVQDILLRNRDRIKDEANIDDMTFNKVMDELTENPPGSLDEDDVVADAITYAFLFRPEDEHEAQLDQGDKMSNAITPSGHGRSGVAVQQHVNTFSGNPEDRY